MWLDEVESRAWLGLMASLSLLDTALDRQLQRDSGLTHTQYGILARLSAGRERTAHMSDLAVATSSSQSRLSHAVAGLEALGWVRRSRCPVNGRAVHATLTDDGAEKLAAAAGGHVRLVRRLVFDQLTREQVRSLTMIEDSLLSALKTEGYEIPCFPVDAEKAPASRARPRAMVGGRATPDD